jgi:hypothetical protein
MIPARTIFLPLFTFSSLVVIVMRNLIGEKEIDQ